MAAYMCASVDAFTCKNFIQRLHIKLVIIVSFKEKGYGFIYVAPA